MKRFKNNVKFIFSLLVLCLYSISAYACFTGCVVDKCSGEPLANYPYTICAPLPNFMTNCQTYYTGSDGCFYAEGGVGSSIGIGDRSATYNGGPCINMGSVSVIAVKGTLGNNSNSGFNPFWQGSSNSVGVLNHKVTDCGDEYSENYIGFSYMPSIEILEKYCIKIEVYQVSEIGEVLIKTIGWIPYLDSRGINYNTGVNISYFMGDLSKGIYRLKVSVKCCTDPSINPIQGLNTFSGSFQWNPPITPGDVEFYWLGSNIQYVYNLNNDIPDGLCDNSPLHPNDGQVKILGQTSCGVTFNNYSTNNSITKIRYTLKQMPDCNTGGPTIWSQILYPTSGSQLSAINFNTVTSSFFSLHGPNLANIENTFFPVLYQYEDCFEFIVEVWGNPNCPPKINSGVFIIYEGETNARIISGNEQLDIKSLMDATDIDEQTKMELRKIFTQQKSSTIYPNPTTGVINIPNSVYDTEVDLFDQLGRSFNIPYSAGQMDISHLPDGLYFLKSKTSSGNQKTDKIVKLTN